MIGKQDAAGADPQAARHGGDLTNEDLGRRTGDTAHRMVLSDPKAREAKRVDSPRKGDDAADGFRSGHPRACGSLVKDRERGHVG